MRWEDLKEQFLFGLIDGLNGAVGLVIGLERSHAAARLIFVALLSRAGSSAVSMAGAEYESEDQDDKRTLWGHVGAMGTGYLSSALLPGLGFAFGREVGITMFIPATILVLSSITRFRAKRDGWIRAALTTLTIFVLAVGAGLLASLVGD